MGTIHVNKGDWDKLTAAQKERIRKGLVAAGSIGKGDRIVGTLSVGPYRGFPEPGARATHPRDGSVQGNCENTCGGTYASGLAFCGSLPYPINVGCIVASTAGYGLCLGKCRSAHERNPTTAARQKKRTTKE